jgi:hypothetical protein
LQRTAKMLDPLHPANIAIFLFTLGNLNPFFRVYWDGVAFVWGNYFEGNHAAPG